jgi:hypothetical protein
MSLASGSNNDAFYTPSWLAEELAECLPNNLRGAVLDPTIGGGALLAAVRKRFANNVTALGIDIDRNTLRALRSSEPDWILSHADVLSAASRRTSRAWQEARLQVAAVVLNPPFSYRGNQGVNVSFGDFRGRVAPAMHFLVELMLELSPMAGFYAILPDGAIEADKHHELWVEIRRHFEVERLRRFKTTSFRGARVSTSLVRLRSFEATKLDTRLVSEKVAPAKLPKRRNRCLCVEVVRGRVPVHSVKERLELNAPVVPFLHTTNLSRMPSSDELAAHSRLADDAPLVLLTRVGSWRNPVVVEIGRVVLSDCLFGLRPRDRLELDHLRTDIEHAQSSFRALFKGTGAQYLTLAALVAQIEQIGWHPHVVRASRPLEACCCGRRATSCRNFDPDIPFAERSLF